MSKIATMYNLKGEDPILRKDVYKLKEAVNKMQTVDTGWTEFSNLSADRTCDADSTTVAELADILGTLIEKLKDAGIIGE